VRALLRAEPPPRLPARVLRRPTALAFSAAASWMGMGAPPATRMWRCSAPTSATVGGCAVGGVACCGHDSRVCVRLMLAPPCVQAMGSATAASASVTRGGGATTAPTAPPAHPGRQVARGGGGGGPPGRGPGLWPPCGPRAPPPPGPGGGGGGGGGGGRTGRGHVLRLACGARSPPAAPGHQPAPAPRMQAWRRTSGPGCGSWCTRLRRRTRQRGPPASDRSFTCEPRRWLPAGSWQRPPSARACGIVV
jgi:hypothetical protein